MLIQTHIKLFWPQGWNVCSKPKKKLKTITFARNMKIFAKSRLEEIVFLFLKSFNQFPQNFHEIGSKQTYPWLLVVFSELPK